VTPRLARAIELGTVVYLGKARPGDKLAGHVLAKPLPATDRALTAEEYAKYEAKLVKKVRELPGLARMLVDEIAPRTVLCECGGGRCHAVLLKTLAEDLAAAEAGVAVMHLRAYWRT
jgi:hypothetical protein